MAGQFLGVGSQAEVDRYHRIAIHTQKQKQKEEKKCYAVCIQVQVLHT
jgi:hypothetical protein